MAFNTDPVVLSTARLLSERVSSLPPTPVTRSIGTPIAASIPRRLKLSPSCRSSPDAARTAVSCPTPAARPPSAAAPAITGIEAPPVATAAPTAPAIGSAAPAVSAKKSDSDRPSSSTARNLPPVSFSSR